MRQLGVILLFAAPPSEMPGPNRGEHQRSE
jgi:hypothetical protein